MHLCLFLESLVPGVSSLKIVGSRRKQQFWDEIDNGAFCHYLLLLLLPNIAHKFVKIMSRYLPNEQLYVLKKISKTCCLEKFFCIHQFGVRCG